MVRFSDMFCVAKLRRTDRWHDLMRLCPIENLVFDICRSFCARGSGEYAPSDAFTFSKAGLRSKGDRLTQVGILGFHAWWMKGWQYPRPTFYVLASPLLYLWPHNSRCCTWPWSRAADTPFLVGSRVLETSFNIQIAYKQKWFYEGPRYFDLPTSFSVWQDGHRSNRVVCMYIPFIGSKGSDVRDRQCSMRGPDGGLSRIVGFSYQGRSISHNGITGLGVRILTSTEVKFTSSILSLLQATIRMVSSAYHLHTEYISELFVLKDI